MDNIYELEAVASAARELLHQAAYSQPFHYMHGVEVLPGLFNVYNEVTGQSKAVLYHEQSGYIFKRYLESNRGWTASGAYIGTCVLDGVEHQIRLPRFYVFGTVCAQEFINSELHTCDDVNFANCMHSQEVRSKSGYQDAHIGNWKVFNGEVVLFDFD